MTLKAMRLFQVFLGVSVLASSAWAAFPPCMDGKNQLPVMNEQVLEWKTTTANQFLARAHVQGPITKLYADRNGHKHFEIRLGPDSGDTLEVVYNVSFGKLPSLTPGMNVETCGDYITSTAQAGGYVPSPDGAIIHWVHRNPKPKGHESGYVAINGVLYGQGNGDASGLLPLKYFEQILLDQQAPELIESPAN